MKTPHFFKLRSRLGLLHPPIQSLEINEGVEWGADDILSDSFLEFFPESRIDVFDFPDPKGLTPLEYDRVIAQSSRDCASFIRSSLKSDEIQVVIGGDHSITFPSFLSVLEREKQGDSIGYIQFDSHGDMNLRRESLTDNFHGMYVRALIDPSFDMPETKALVPCHLSSQQFLFVGNLDLDATGERQFFEKECISRISKQMIREKKKEVLDSFSEFLARFKHVHVTFDIDSLDKSIASATGIPAQDGLLLEDIWEMLGKITRHHSYSFDLAEVNPAKSGAQKTIETAQEVLRAVLLK